jgi:hypothetical protein
MCSGARPPARDFFALLAIQVAMLGIACNSVRMSNTNTGSKGSMRLLEDTKEMEGEVLKCIPIGTSWQDARAIMEQNGFDCSISYEGGAGAPHLYCVLERVWKQPVVRKWQIRIDYDRGGVSSVVVSSGLIGP